MAKRFVLSTLAVLGAALLLGACASSGAAVTASAPTTGWGKAEPVPGLAALASPGWPAALNSISCASPGNCAAVGDYQFRGGYQGFLVSQVHGHWGDAELVPGLSALDKGRKA